MDDFILLIEEAFNMVPSSRLPDPAPAPSAESPSLMTIPTEIRLKIYEALYDKVQVKYTVKTINSQLWRREYQIVRRMPEQYYPFAVLTVNKKISREAQRIVSNCPVLLEFEGCTDHCSLNMLLPRTVLRRTHSITTDESFWYADVGSLKCCLDTHIYPNLRHLELRGPPKQIQMPRDVIESLAKKNDFYGYELSPELCTQVQNSWPSWAPQVAPLIVSGLLTLTIRCDLAFREQQGPDPYTEAMDVSVLGVYLLLPREICHY
jgi:hypothetical protein